MLSSVQVEGIEYLEVDCTLPADHTELLSCRPPLFLQPTVFPSEQSFFLSGLNRVIEESGS